MAVPPQLPCGTGKVGWLTNCACWGKAQSGSMVAEGWLVPEQGEKRSSVARIGQVLELGRLPGQGVGGRQAPGPALAGGGGYLGSRTGQKFEKIARDPRLDELRTMGLPAYWLRVAEAIGAEAFLQMWRILDAEPSIQGERSDLEMRLRPYRSYLRYQRNRYIEALCAAGLSVNEIQERVQADLCERISLRHISRIATGT